MRASNTSGIHKFRDFSQIGRVVRIAGVTNVSSREKLFHTEIYASVCCSHHMLRPASKNSPLENLLLLQLCLRLR